MAVFVYSVVFIQSVNGKNNSIPYATDTGFLRGGGLSLWILSLSSPKVTISSKIVKDINV